MRLLISLTLLVSLTAVSCSKKATVISPVSQTAGLSAQGMVYALPVTSFRVQVESVHQQAFPGPYAQFAERFLGIANVPLKAKSEWSIAHIDVIEDIEADMDVLFAVEPGDGFQSDFLMLSTMGLVIPLNNIRFQGSNQIGSKAQLQPSNVTFTDLSSTPFIAAERTTHYSRVLQDSTFVRVPVHKTVIVEKSLEDKAREASDFIFSLRKRRYELLAGDADFVAEGKAVEAVLREISRLEDEYLSLFVGKTFESKTMHWFDYTPKPNGDATTILFRFSPSKGVVPASDLSASPILISATSDQGWKSTELLNQLSTEKGNPRTDAVYYRIPVAGNIRITQGINDLYSKRITVYQYGPTVRIPAKFLLRGAGSIHFPVEKK